MMQRPSSIIVYVQRFSENQWQEFRGRYKDIFLSIQKPCFFSPPSG